MYFTTKTFLYKIFSIKKNTNDSYNRLVFHIKKHYLLANTVTIGQLLLDTALA